MADVKRNEEQLTEEEKQYIDELSHLNQRFAHYMTPGAKRYFRRVWMGYAVLAIAGIFGIWSVTNHVDHSIRRDINSAVKAGCLESRKPNSVLNKYNRNVEVQIQNLRESRTINMERGDSKRVDSNTESIIRLQGTKAPIPTVKECNAPLLKE